MGLWCLWLYEKSVCAAAAVCRHTWAALAARSLAARTMGCTVRYSDASRPRPRPLYTPGRSAREGSEGAKFNVQISEAHVRDLACTVDIVVFKHTRKVCRRCAAVG